MDQLVRFQDLTNSLKKHLNFYYKREQERNKNKHQKKHTDNYSTNIIWFRTQERINTEEQIFNCFKSTSAISVTQIGQEKML